MRKVAERIGHKLGQWIEAIPPLTLFVSLLLFTILLPLIKLRGQQQGDDGTPTTILPAPVVGSGVQTKPSGCVETIVRGVSYLRCGSVWYQPQYAGTQVNYIVVTPAR